RRLQAAGNAGLGARGRRIRPGDLCGALQTIAAARGGTASRHRPAFPAGGLRAGDRRTHHRVSQTPDANGDARVSDVQVIAPPPPAGLRRAFVLAEDRIAHYPEFRRFFAETFDLDRDGLKHPGYVTAPSGTHYALVFVGRSGEPFPA